MTGLGLDSRHSAVQCSAVQCNVLSWISNIKYKTRPKSALTVQSRNYPGVILWLRVSQRTLLIWRSFNQIKITTEPELSLGRVSGNLKCKIVADNTILPPSSPPGGVLDWCSYRRNSSFLSLTLLRPNLTIFHSFSTFEKLCSMMWQYLY